MVIIYVMEQRQAQQVDLLATHGLSDLELNQIVSFAGHEGTVRDMITDQRCPVGAQIQMNFEREGFAGTEKAIAGLAMLGVHVQIHDDTRAFYRGEISRETLLIRAARTQQEDKPATDFLA